MGINDKRADATVSLQNATRTGEVVTGLLPTCHVLDSIAGSCATFY